MLLEGLSRNRSPASPRRLIPSATTSLTRARRNSPDPATSLTRTRTQNNLRGPAMLPAFSGPRHRWPAGVATPGPGTARSVGDV